MSVLFTKVICSKKKNEPLTKKEYFLSILVWFQTVCKGYQLTLKMLHARKELILLSSADNF